MKNISRLTPVEVERRISTLERVKPSDKTKKGPWSLHRLLRVLGGKSKKSAKSQKSKKKGAAKVRRRTSMVRNKKATLSKKSNTSTLNAKKATRVQLELAAWELAERNEKGQHQQGSAKSQGKTFSQSGYIEYFTPFLTRKGFLLRFKRRIIKCGSLCL